jgi:hypothetical protein
MGRGRKLAPTRQPLRIDMKLLLASSMACVAFLAFPDRASAWQIRLDELQKLTPTNLVGADKHGQWIALEGDRLLIGAPETTTTGSGRVYAYSRTGSSWTLDQKFGYVFGGPGSSFGRRIALDGDTAVVTNLTSAFVFVHNGSAWALQQSIASPGNTSFYGAAADIDGNTAVVGQPTMTDNQVWVWVRAGSSWSLQQKVEPPNPPQTIGFGEALAVLGDTLFVGAPRDDQAASSAGAVYVFTRNGALWSQQAKLLGSPAYPLRRLGRSLDVQARPGGSFEIVVGAAGSASGEVQVFEGSGATWTQTARILPVTGGSNGWFGSSVRVGGDLMVVGAWLGDASATDTGLATVYRRCGSDWVRQADVLGTDSVSGDNFGLAVDIWGETVVVGAPSHDLVGQDGGSSYVFELSDSPLTLYCHGDGSQSACPCGNELPPGASGGCANSSGAGAVLVLDDSSSRASRPSPTATCTSATPSRSA